MKALIISLLLALLLYGIAGKLELREWERIKRQARFAQVLP